jgi:hypothetical protein
VLLASCGDDASVGAGGATSTTVEGEMGDLALMRFVGPRVLEAQQEARVPFGLADRDGLLPLEQSPERLEVTVESPDGATVAELEVRRHHAGLPRAYYPLQFDAGSAGDYVARTTMGGMVAEMAFDVYGADDLDVIRPGQSLPAVDTPTVDDDRGVTPICTREPVCPLHDVTLATALDDDRPLALLVATPAFCQIAICGPVLDVLLGVTADFEQIRFLHAEPYVDPVEDTTTSTEIVDALQLHYEPVLVLADPAGNVVRRLDTIFDEDELRASLDHLRSAA